MASEAAQADASSTAAPSAVAANAAAADAPTSSSSSSADKDPSAWNMFSVGPSISVSSTTAGGGDGGSSSRQQLQPVVVDDGIGAPQGVGISTAASGVPPPPGPVDWRASLSLENEANKLRLRANLDEVKEIVQSTRYLIQNTVNLPVSGIGRVIDAFNKMAESVADKVDGFYKADFREANLVFSKQAAIYEGHLDDTSRIAKEGLDHQKATLEGAFEAALASKLAAAKEERDRSVKEATQREQDALDKYVQLQQRSGGAEELINAANAKLEKQQDNLAKANATIAKLEAATKKERQVWQGDLEDTLNACTLGDDSIIQKKEVLDPARPWLHNMASKKNANMNALKRLQVELAKLKTPGEQLKALIAAYERAKAQMMHERQQEHDESVREVASAGEQLGGARRELEREHVHVGCLESTIQECEAALTYMDAKVSEMAEELSKAEEKARERAGVESKRLMGELERTRAELSTTQSELSSLKQKHSQMLSQHSSDTAGTMVRHEESTRRLEAKLAACIGALSAARSASKNGGYFFSAAPSTRDVSADPPPVPESPNWSPSSRSNSPLHGAAPPDSMTTPIKSAAASRRSWVPLHSIRLDNVIEANGHSTGWKRDGTPLRTSTSPAVYSSLNQRLGLNQQQSELIRRLTKAAHHASPSSPIGGGKQQPKAEGGGSPEQQRQGATSILGAGSPQRTRRKAKPGTARPKISL